ATDRPQLPAAELLRRQLDLHRLGFALLVARDAYAGISRAQRPRETLEVAAVWSRYDRDRAAGVRASTDGLGYGADEHNVDAVGPSACSDGGAWAVLR